jgi:uncharacterized protein YndB with AHSA1/START domain
VPPAIRVIHGFNARPARVFASWLDPGTARRWLFATAWHPIAEVEIDAQVGGWFRFIDRSRDQTIEHTGKFIEIVPNRRLVFALSLAERPHLDTRVTIDIGMSRKGCTLTLAHDNVPADLIGQIRNRWLGNLYGLGVALDEEPPSRDDYRKKS